MQRNQIRRKRKYTARKDRNENTILQQNKRAKVNETKKIIFRLRIQSNTRKEGNTLKQQRVSKIKMQSNTKKEGITLMKQLKRVSKIKIQN